MDFLFGIIPLGDLALWLGAITGVLVLALLALAAAHPVLLKMALRNIPRRPLQTGLIVGGLMLATLLITASLQLGDSVAYSFKIWKMNEVGNLDEGVSKQPAGGAGQPALSAAEAAQLTNTIRAVPQVAAVRGASIGAGAVVDLTTHQAHAENVVVAAPPDFGVVWGPLRSQAGTDLGFADLGAGEVFIGRRLAAALAAHPGDHLQLAVNGLPREWTVRAILDTDIYINRVGSTPTAGTVVLPLAQFQELLGQPGAVTTLFIKNQGNGGLDDLGPYNQTSQAVVLALRAQFAQPAQTDRFKTLIDRPPIRAALVATYNRLNPANPVQQALGTLLVELDKLGVSDELKLLVQNPAVQTQINAAFAQADPTGLAELTQLETQLSRYTIQAIKQDLVEQAENLAGQITALTLVLNLFSLLVGSLLIYLIFVMLAAERRAELGMSRAIGLKRRHLTAMFLLEGSAYALGAGLLGVVLGVGAGEWLTGVIAGPYLAAGTAFAIRLYVQGPTLLIAFCFGFLLTLVVVGLSAQRVSHLNIVAAIRDLDDAEQPAPAGARWGQLAVPVGLLLLVAGAQSRIMVGYVAGVVLLVAGLGLALRRLLPRLGVPPARADRLSYSGIGLALIVYLAQPFGPVEKLLGVDGRLGLAGFQSGQEVFVLDAVLTMAGAIGLVIYNSDWLLAGVLFLTQGVAGLAPIARTSIAYPLTFKFRTWLMIAMFALVVFVVTFLAVVIASIQQQFSRPDSLLGGWPVVAGTPMFNYVPGKLVPPDLTAQVQANPTLGADIAAAGGENRPVLSLRQVVAGAALPVPLGRHYLHIVDDGYLAGSVAPIRPRAAGYSGDRAVWDAVRDQDGLAVLANAANPAPGASGSVNLSGVDIANPRGFQPFEIEIVGPQGARQRVRVIGFVDHLNLYWNGLYTSVRTGSHLLGAAAAVPTGYYIRPRAGVDLARVQRDLETAFIGSGGLESAQANVDLQDVAEVETALLDVLLNFMALGLISGVAGLGVISSRMVIERRQQIGLLRASGYSRAMVQRSFLVEASFIALTGLGIGAAGGLWAAYRFFHDAFAPSAGVTAFPFAVPVPAIAGILGAVYLAALLTTLLPARAAAHVPPTAALRYE